MKNRVQTYKKNYSICKFNHKSLKKSLDNNANEICKDRLILMPQILVYRLRRALSRAHGEDDRGRAGNDVAAGKDPLP